VKGSSGLLVHYVQITVLLILRTRFGHLSKMIRDEEIRSSAFKQLKQDFVKKVRYATASSEIMASETPS